MSAPLTKPRFTGARVTRLEDARLLRGQGRYLDDIDVPGMLEMAFVRSTRAAARILSIDTTAAARLPGVHAVLTGEDCAVDLPTKRFEVNQPVLARGEVRFVGEPVVAIIADSRYIAEDAADLVQIRYEALPPVLHAHAALSDSPRRVHSHRENAFALSEKVTPGFEDAFASAPRHASARFMTHRQTGAAMENRGCAAMTDPASGRLTVYCSHQSPHQFRSDLTELLGLAENLIRVVVPEVGGAFGIKAMFYPEYVVVAYAAQLLRRPVKWVSDRTESLLSDCHSRDNSIDASVAFDDAGHIIAVKATFLGDTGAYPIFGFPGAVGETGWASNMLTGPYKIPYVSLTRQHVFSNKTPVGAYRGVGGPVGAQVQEGIVELVARELSMDPADVRRVNMIQPEDFPYTTATGNLYDPGSYGESMEQALSMIGYDEFRRSQETLRADGKYQGIGICVFVEPSAGASSEAGSIPYEAATVRIEPTGTVTAAFGLGPSGQGHETTMAQIIADELGIDVQQVVVLHGDTDSAPFGGGTGGSRSGTIGGGAAIQAGEAMRHKLQRIAAHLLEASDQDIELKDGKAFVTGVPSKSFTIHELAQIAYTDVTRLPEDMPIGLEVVARSRPRLRTTYSNGTHVAKVEVDIHTGFVRVLDYVAVNDCGNLINPAIVEGQIHGGVAQGIGSALLEELKYDENGQLTTTSLADYLLPVSTEVPTMRIGHIMTASANDGGFKGMGEGSLIAAPPAIANAVTDALRGFNVLVTDIPIYPHQVLRWVEAGKAATK